LSLLAGQILNGIATGMLYALMGLGLSAHHRDPQHPELRPRRALRRGRVSSSSRRSMFSATSGSAWSWRRSAWRCSASPSKYAGIRRLYAAGHDYQLLFTFGLSLILAEGIILVWGPVASATSA